MAPVAHGVAWALSFRDPDGNGIALSCRRRGAPGAEAWRGRSAALPVQALLAGAPTKPAVTR